jgi:hypothetical protein
MSWTPAWLGRIWGLSEASASEFMAVTVGPMAGLFALFAGFIFSRARRSSPAKPLMLCSFVALAVLALYVLGYCATTTLGLGAVSLAIAIGPVVNTALMSGIQEVAKPAYRATAMALVVLPDAAFGGGAGALSVGLLSDIGAGAFGVKSLTYALLAVVVVSLGLSFFLYQWCARRLVRDLSDQSGIATNYSGVCGQVHGQ